MVLRADFENLLQYEGLGTTFTKEYVTTIYLQKIDGIYYFRSPYSSFFATIASLPDENQNIEYVKERFIRIAENNSSKVAQKRAASASKSISLEVTGQNLKINVGCSWMLSASFWDINKHKLQEEANAEQLRDRPQMARPCHQRCHL